MTVLDFLDEYTKKHIEDSEKSKKEAYDKIKSLYKSGYRHEYNEIYFFISQYDAFSLELENLEHNIQTIFEFSKSIENREDENIEKSINKIRDYVTLEIGRARNQYQKFSIYEDNLKSNIEEQENRYNELKKKTKILSKKIHGYQSNIITIVSLLVSIVPLLATNISYISQDLSVLAIMMCNGTMILVIGIVFLLISFIVKPCYKMGIASIIAILLGTGLIIFSIVYSETTLLDSIKNIS